MQVHGLRRRLPGRLLPRGAEHADVECIDCTLCEPECPVEAIFAEDDVPDAQREFTALNRERAQVWKPIIERKSPPPDADQWAKVKDKKKFLEK